jgi:hypothetical protein
MRREPLHRDDEDGRILLLRLPGDRWRVAANQEDCDFIRTTEVQSPGKSRFGVAGFSEDIQFVRVERVEEEKIERPELASSNQGEGQ